MSQNTPADLSPIVKVGASTHSAWYAELKKCPPLLSNADIRNVLGIGQTKAWGLHAATRRYEVGNRLKLDRNALIAYLISNRVHVQDRGMSTLNELLHTPVPSGTPGRAVAGVSERTRSGACESRRERKERLRTRQRHPPHPPRTMQSSATASRRLSKPSLPRIPSRRRLRPPHQGQALLKARRSHRSACLHRAHGVFGRPRVHRPLRRMGAPGGERRGRVGMGEVRAR